MDDGPSSWRLEEERDRLEQAQSDPEKFVWFHERFYHPILWFICGLVHDPELAEELTSRTFANALSGLPRFKWRGHGLAAYLHRIAWNEAARHWRLKGRWIVVGVGAAELLPDPEPSALLGLAAAERLRILRAEVDRLPDRDRRLIVMYYWEGISAVQIAEMLGRPAGTIQSRLHRAREKLRRRMDEADAPRLPVTIGPPPPRKERL